MSQFNRYNSPPHPWALAIPFPDPCLLAGCLAGASLAVPVPLAIVLAACWLLCLLFYEGGGFCVAPILRCFSGVSHPQHQVKLTSNIKQSPSGYN